MTPLGDRIHTIDAVRGAAVMGILLMNIVSFGLPDYALIDPRYYGLTGPSDWFVWAANYVFSEGKFRALFTMLFGASMVVMSERVRTAADDLRGAASHYRRMIWLFVIGMIHAWGFWYGDILVQYAIGGTLGFLFWRWPPRALWLLVAAMMALQSADSINYYVDTASVRTAAVSTGASPVAVALWEARKAQDLPTQNEAVREVQGYRGNIATVFATRADTTNFFQTIIMLTTMPEIFAFMALGIIFYRNGFLTGAWSRRAYCRAIAVGYLIAAPLTALMAWALVVTHFDPAIQSLCEAGSLILRPWIAVAHAAMVILLVRSGYAVAFVARITAIGRTALSNYLGTTIIATTLFYGYGFGLFGRLGRAELYIVVVAIWAIMLLWSKRWLSHFHYGPAEWLWRSLARKARQPMRR